MSGLDNLPRHTCISSFHLFLCPSTIDIDIQRGTNRVEPNWRLQTFLAHVQQVPSQPHYCYQVVLTYCDSTTLQYSTIVPLLVLPARLSYPPAVVRITTPHTPTLSHISPPTSHPEPSPPTRLAHHRNCGANTCRTLRSRRQASTTREQHSHNHHSGSSHTLLPPAPSRAPTQPTS